MQAHHHSEPLLAVVKAETDAATETQSSHHAVQALLTAALRRPSPACIPANLFAGAAPSRALYCTAQRLQAESDPHLRAESLPRCRCFRDSRHHDSIDTGTPFHCLGVRQSKAAVLL